jgi:hypothetical protein
MASLEALKVACYRAPGNLSRNYILRKAGFVGTCTPGDTWVREGACAEPGGEMVFIGPVRD